MSGGAETDVGIVRLFGACGGLLAPTLHARSRTRRCRALSRVAASLRWSKPASSSMKLLVLAGKERHQVQVPGSCTAAELKDKLAKAGVPAQFTGDGATLIMAGDELCDEMTLAEQGVQDRERLELRAPAPPAAPAPGGPMSEALSQIQAIELNLDELQAKLRASQNVHQEYFTRVLESVKF